MTEPFDERGEQPPLAPHRDRDQDEPSAEPGSTVELGAITFVSDHGMLKACDEDVDWRDAGKLCPEPEWTPEHSYPLSHSMGKKVQLRVLSSRPSAETGDAILTLRGEGPQAMTLRGRTELDGRATYVAVSSQEPLERRVQKLSLEIHWSAEGGGALSPGQTSNTVYVTMGRPKILRDENIPEQGVTLRRMDKAVEWVAPMNTLDPHEIVAGLMDKFPYYALLPSPAVPPRYKHPTYFNDQGGAWPMAEYVEQSGECQAIVRLIRGVLFQLGVLGKTRVVVVWADPNIDEGARPLFADLEEHPRAGLDTRGVINGRPVFAALVDSPVEEGKSYPPSHTRMEDGGVSPGLNRYEACLEFSYRGRTRYYCGGAGVFDAKDKESILHVFWGLAWMSPLGGGEEGYRVEKIVQRYREGGEGSR